MASHLIGQHQITTFTSPTNGTTPIDANTVRGNDNTIKTAYDAHDVDETIHVQDSVVASRPVASVAGRKWLATDAAAFYLYYDDGAAWNEISYLHTASPTFTGALISTTAFATPSALSATQFTAFASTVSGATLMGFGTTGDVTLKNRAGTDVIVVTANTLNVTMAGALALTGDFAVNTSKFAVTASSGNTSVAGTLAVTGNFAVNLTSFTVTASSGNTAIAGTLNVTGAATFASGTITANAPALSITQTWNNAAVAFAGLFLNVTNTASAATATLMDLQVASVSQFSVGKTGGVSTIANYTTTTATGGVFYAISGNTTALYLNLANTGGSMLMGRESVAGGTIFTGSSSYATVIGGQAGVALELAANNTVYLGIVGVAGTPANSSVGNLYVKNGTAPTGTPTGQYFLWAESGALKGRGTSGTNTTIGAAEPHCPVCDSDFGLEWENPKYGHLQICMKCLVGDVAASKPYIRFLS